MKKFPAAFLVLIMALISACVIASPDPGSPSDDPLPGPTAVEESPQPPASEAATPEEPDPTQPETNAPTSQAAFLERACSSEDYSQWCLLENSQAFPVTPPPGTPQVHDFSPSSRQILYGSEFPDHGAGPGNKAVTDLWILDPLTGEKEQLVADEIVVRARWAPNGVDLAYIRAAVDTYELVWYSGGTEVVLAVDAHFVFDISSTGDQVAFTREPDMGIGPGTGLYVVDTQTGAERLISEIDREGGGSIEDRPHWSPDDRIILLPMIQETDGIATLVASTNGSGSSLLAFDPSTPEDLRAYPLPNELLWGTDGSQLLVEIYTGNMMAEGQYLVVRYDLSSDRSTVAAAEILVEDARLIGWQTPGKTLWLLPTAGDSTLPFLFEIP